MKIMKKSLLKRAIVGTILTTTLISTNVYASTWTKIGDTWNLINELGAKLNGWQINNGHWYYLNSEGSMTTGWKLVNAKWYYLNPSGDMATGWKLAGGKWYYLNPNGDMAFSTTVGGYVLGADGVWIPSSTTGNTGSGTNTGGSTSNTGNTNNGGSTVWIPSSGEVRTIAGISTNMTRDQLTALSVEAPENAIANDILQPRKLPQDGKLYHHRDSISFSGMKRYSDAYCKYLGSFVDSNGIAKNHFLEIRCSQNSIVSFADVVEW